MPRSLKLETWLILNKIPYENVYSLKFSKKGQIPYIELNGEQIADSNVVIRTLSLKFGLKEDHLSQVDKAIGHSVDRMVENHTCKGGFLWRYGYNMDEFLVKGTTYYDFSPLKSFIYKYAFPLMTKLKTRAHGLGCHSLEEVAEFTFEDLRAISSILGDKKYLLTEDKMTAYDCTLFGHLVQFLYIPMDFPQKKFMQENCPNLVAYVDRIRDDLWPNWDEMCQRNCMMDHYGWDLKEKK